MLYHIRKFKILRYCYKNSVDGVVSYKDLYHDLVGKSRFFNDEDTFFEMIIRLCLDDVVDVLYVDGHPSSVVFVEDIPRDSVHVSFRELMDELHDVL